MKILVEHNHYGDRATGGEATVFAQETELLRFYGCQVSVYERSNAEILNWSPLEKLTLPLRFGHSPKVYRELVELIDRERPDILHAHNYKYVLTPAIFRAAKDCGVKTVLTLHNFRLICPGGQLRRGDRICEECLRKNPARVLWRPGCASQISTRVLQSLFYWETKKRILKDVDVFVALTEFSKSKFVEGGLPKERIWVKPNFVFDPLTEPDVSADEQNDSVGEALGEEFGGDGGNRRRENGKREGAVFVGRLSSEKGVRFLMEAWRGVDFPLTIVGDGPEGEAIRQNAPSNVRFVGQKTRKETLKLMQSSCFLVFPSIWYETFGMTIIEAAALGTPALASNLGGRSEIIVDGETGLLFESANIDDFRNAACRLIRNQDYCRRLGERARRRYEAFYSPQKNFEMLTQIYRAALD